MGDITDNPSLVSNTSNMNKARCTSNQIIKTLAFSDVTNIASISVNPNQVIGFVITAIKITSGTYQIRIVGATSGTAYYTSATLSNTSSKVISGSCIMTGTVAESIKVQALSSETTNGVQIDSGTTLGSQIACGDICVALPSTTININIPLIHQVSSFKFTYITNVENGGELGGGAGIQVNGYTSQDDLAFDNGNTNTMTITLGKTQLYYGVSISPNNAFFSSANTCLVLYSFTGNYLSY